MLSQNKKSLTHGHQSFFNIGCRINRVELELSLTNKQLSLNVNQEREMSAFFMVLNDFGFISNQA